MSTIIEDKMEDIENTLLKMIDAETKELKCKDGKCVIDRLVDLHIPFVPNT